jgi:hypothetical protein
VHCAGRYDNTTQGFIAHAQKTAMLFVVVLAVWALSGFGYFWPAWVLLFAGLKLGAHARRVYVHRADFDGDGFDAEFDGADAPDSHFV